MNFEELVKQDGISKFLPEGETYTAEKGTEQHIKFYTYIVNKLGYENVKRCIPFTLAEIKTALPKDEHLNNLTMAKWDMASGFVCSGTRCDYIGSTLTRLYHSIGVNSFSNSDGVCILKRCAAMWASEAVQND